MLGITIVVHNRSVPFDLHLSNCGPDPIYLETYLDFDLDHDSDLFLHERRRFAWEVVDPYSCQVYSRLNLETFHPHFQNFAITLADYLNRGQVAGQASLRRTRLSSIQEQSSRERSSQGFQQMAHVDLEVAFADLLEHCFHPPMPLLPPVFEQRHSVECIQEHQLDPDPDDIDLS
jgi:hypothetical protein